MSTPGEPHDRARGGARDPVEEYLVSRGMPPTIRREGLRGIIARWDAIARTAEHYDLALDDWLNDVDLRDLIAGAIAVAPERVRPAAEEALARADDAFRAATVETRRSLWGDAVGDADRHDPGQQWWYFRRPAHPGETMQADLTAAGIA